MGIDPLKLLFPRSSVVNALQSPISTGIFPSKKFEFKFSTERAVRLPISFGILPFKRLPLRTRVSNVTAFPISTGRVPSSILFPAENSIKLFELHKLTGMVPVKLLESRSITINGSSERYSGIEPLM
ncbi:hypothetical protein ES319_D08G120700v1 [Gossypium barbadense]|uniref:Uncharacterized protein n=2 Tax=Gossypium TaxID=3633 RepID=A0A5J5QCP4_GOSBA|nr:hypothetical protein ES319_D08G120700v1 [Gossypium barbadense]TYH57955.1 hypothetical protein ES332_D08G123200v1 [Gossypium tomentosum]